MSCRVIGNGSSTSYGFITVAMAIYESDQEGDAARLEQEPH